MHPEKYDTHAHLHVHTYTITHPCPQFIKLPRQTRVTPEEYREFLSLGHGEIFTLDLDR